MSSEEHDIVITHIINPHMFWYRHVDSSSRGADEELFQIESQLNQHITLDSTFQKGIMKNGDLVAVRHLSWGRFIRGRVELVFDSYVSGKSYVVWALDYGMTVQSTQNNIRLLPPRFHTRKFSSINFGGLANVIPAEKIFNFARNADELTESKRWSQRAVEIFSKLIEHAANIKFTEKYQIHVGEDQQVFGGMKIATHLNQQIIASVCLSEQQLALSCGSDEFKHKITTLPTNKIPRYMNSSNSNETFLDSSLSCDSEITRKVVDWKLRNGAHALESQPAEESGQELEDISIDHITFNDSVSGVHQTQTQSETPRMLNQYKKSEQRPANSDIEENLDDSISSEVYKKASAMTKMNKEKYADYSPPKPSADTLYRFMGGYEESNISSVPTTRSGMNSIEKFSNDSAKSMQKSAQDGGTNQSVASGRVKVLLERRTKRTVELKSGSSSEVETRSGSKDDHQSVSSVDVSDKRQDQNGSRKESLTTTDKNESSKQRECSTESRPLGSRVRTMFEARQKYSRFSDRAEKSFENSQCTNVAGNTLQSVDRVQVEEEIKETKPEHRERNEDQKHGIAQMESRGSEAQNLRKKLQNIPMSSSKFIPAGYDLRNLQPEKKSKESTNGFGDQTSRNMRNFRIAESRGVKMKSGSTSNSNSSGGPSPVATSNTNSNFAFKQTSEKDNLQREKKSRELTSQCSSLPRGDLCDETSRDVQDFRSAGSLGGKMNSGSTSDINSFGDSSSTLQTTSNPNLNFTSLQKSEKDNLQSDKKSGESPNKCSSLRYENCEKNISHIAKCDQIINSFKNRMPGKFDNHEDLRFEAQLDLSNLVLAHGRNPGPIKIFAEAGFTDEIYQELKNMYLDKIYRVQAYVWPHLMRGNSAVIINSNKTGKTISYLPAICSLLQMQLMDGEIDDGCGPIVVIVLQSSQEVERTTRLCKRLLCRSKPSINIVSSFGMRNHLETATKIFNGCDILVSTPASVERLLDDKMTLIDLKRIRHLVFDDVNLSHHMPLIQRLIQTRQEDCKIVNQLVITSKSWHNLLRKKLNICRDPLLCIGDYLEAAVYARASFNIAVSLQANKLKSILRFLDQHPYDREKLLIVCNNETEVIEIVAALKNCSYSCTGYSQSSSAAEITLGAEWNKKISQPSEILVCTDNELRELKLQTVQNLINYSMPSSWTKFKYRFSTMLGYYDDLVKCKFATDVSKPSAQILILLDENNNTQLPKLIDFLVQHGQSNTIPNNVLQLAKKLKILREEERATQVFCPRILEFGSCVQSDCIYRHVLTKFDAAYEGIPTSGDIKIEIINVVSPIHYRARLLEYCRDGNSSRNWHTIRQSDTYIKFMLELSYHLSQVSNQQLHWPLSVNDVCVYSNNGSFSRCKILKVPENLSENIIKSIIVHIKLVDNGDCTTCKSSQILQLPEQYKSFPFQSVDIRLIDVMPFDNEHMWDSKSIATVRQWLSTNVNKKDCIVANINCAMMDTIWVNNVNVLEEMNYTSNFCYKIRVRESLLQKNFGVKNDQLEGILKQMAADCGIEMTREEVEIRDLNESKSSSESYENCEDTSHNHENGEKEQKTQLQTHEKWSRIELDTLTNINLGAFFMPNCLYIQNNDPQTIGKLEAMDLAIAEHISSDGAQILTDWTVGVNCLAKFDGQFQRAKVTKISCECRGRFQAKLFFVDSGFSAILKLDEVYECPANIVEWAPFQAIRCRLTGIVSRINGIWTKEVCDQVYDEIFESCSNVFVYAVRELPNDEIDLKFNVYEVLLVEKKEGTYVNLNKEIINRDLADADEETKHFLELEFELIVNEEELYECDEENVWDSKLIGYIFNLPSTAKILPPGEISENIAKIKEIVEEQSQKVAEKKSTGLISNNGNSPGTGSSLAQIVEEPSQKVAETKSTGPISNNGNFSGTNSAHVYPATTYKFPATTWHQDAYSICLRIHAPDICEYILKVRDDRIFFAGVINSQMHAFELNLEHNVDSSCAIAEIRGLYVVVRVKKMLLSLNWKRLTKVNCPWLKPDLGLHENDDVDEEITVDYERRQNRYSDEEMSDASEEYDKYKNPQDMYDPLADFDFA